MIFTLEKVLYWCHEKKGMFNVQRRDWKKRTTLSNIISQCLREDWVVLCKNTPSQRYYKITPSGKKKLEQFQMAFKDKKDSKKKSIKAVNVSNMDNFLDEPVTIRPPVHKNMLELKACHKVPRTYSVYKGEHNGVIVYIGTTIQQPSARFRWHKANGKALQFTVLEQYDNPEQMLAKEFELIKKLKPKLNKITERAQNLNVKLTPEQLAAREGDAEWCQKCLRRRAKVKTKCNYCG